MPIFRSWGSGVILDIYVLLVSSFVYLMLSVGICADTKKERRNSEGRIPCRGFTQGVAVTRGFVGGPGKHLRIIIVRQPPGPSCFGAPGCSQEACL
jgi:hypothetical protein